MYTILYVDDEESLLNLGKMFIEQMGDFSVDTAISAKRALEVLEHNKYDAIISDYQMPGMDGIALLKHLRKTSDVPFILFTGKGREEVVIDALNSGADFYLQKGGEPKSQFTELVHKLDLAISKKEAEEAQKQAEQDLVQLNEEIQIKFEEEKVISEFSRVLLNAETVAEILDYFEKIIFSRSGADYMMLSRWDPVENVVRIHSLTGLDPYLEPIEKLVNVAPQSLNVPVSVINACTTTAPEEPGLHRLDGGIHTISRGHLPKPICIAIEKMLGIQTISIYELIRGGNLYGGVTFGFRKGHEIQNLSLINTLSNLLGNGLWRVYSTNAIVHDREALRTSEMKFRSILDNMQDIFYRTDQEGNLIFISPSGVSIAGYTSADEMIGINVAESFYTDPDERSAFFATLEKSGRVDNYPLVLKARDNSLHNILANCHYYYDDAGTILGTEGMLHDVTGITIAEKTIKASEEKFRSLVENSLEPILISDLQGTVLFANNASLKLTGIGDSTTITDMNVMDFIAPESLEDVIRDFIEVSHGHDAFLSNYQLLANGKKISVESIGKLITYDDRPADLISLRDITERKEHQEVVREKNQMLTTLYDLQRIFAEIPAGMRIEEVIVHELSTRFGVVAVFSRYDPFEEVLHATCIEFGPELLKKIPNAMMVATRLVGKRPEDVRMPINKEAYRDISRSIVSMKKTVAEISYGTVSPVIGATAQKLGGIDHFIHISHIIDGELYGISIIGIKHGQPDPSRELLESFAHIVAVSLRRQRAETGLRESEERLRSFVAQALEGISLVDEEGRIIEWNPALEKITGTSRNEVMGVHVWDIATRMIPDEHHRESVRSKIEESVKSTIKSGIIPNTGPTCYPMQRPDGTTARVKQTVFSIDTSQGHMIGTLYQDVTEEKRAEEALHQANKKLTLLSSITRHDINNQLTVLQGYLDMLETRQPDPLPNEYYQEVSTAAERIFSMIEFTKEYEMIGINAPTWQDCRTLVDTAAKEAQIGQVIVKNSLPSGTTVFADPLIARVFYNLMDNAVRHGGNITTIRFFAEKRDDNLILVCEDDGRGIVPEEKEKIFRRGVGKNTGMGLFLTREILSITGITTCETGEPGMGARFEITVPHGTYQIPDTP